MLEIKKQYIIDENNKKVAVLVHIDTFQKIEQLLEDYGLTQMMLEVETEPVLDLESAKRQYAELSECS